MFAYLVYHQLNNLIEHTRTVHRLFLLSRIKMKFNFSVLRILAILASSANASPVPQEVSVSFHGAEGTQFEQSFYIDNSDHEICMT